MPGYLNVVRALAAMGVLLVASCRGTPGGETGAASPAGAAVEQAAWYESEIRALLEADRAAPPAPGGVVFVGSSSIRMWGSLAEDMSPMPVLNRGFGGSKTREVLAEFDRIVVPCRPSVVVYYCGDNDLGTENTDSRAAAGGFIEFAERVRVEWDGVEVHDISIKPSLARWRNWEAMARANETVRAYCESTPGVWFLNVATPALGADGTPDPTIFLDDGLHLNAKGYGVWTGVVRGPVLAAWERRRMP